MGLKELIGVWLYLFRNVNFYDYQTKVKMDLHATSPFTVGMQSCSTTIQKISRADAVQALGVLNFIFYLSFNLRSVRWLRFCIV